MKKICQKKDIYLQKKDNKYLTKLRLEISKWIEISDKSNGTYDTDNQIKFKSTMLKSCLCDYSDTYILAKGRMTIAGAGDNDQARRKVIFKKFN